MSDPAMSPEEEPMPRRRAAPAPPDTATGPQPLAGTAVVPAQRVAPPDTAAWLIEGVWCGVSRYACSLCPFDSLDRAHAHAHVLQAHAALFIPPAPAGQDEEA
jgi:hypothetical protein